MHSDPYPTSAFLKDYLFFLKGKRLRFCWLALLKSLSDANQFAIAYCLGRIVDLFTKPVHSLTEFYILVGIIAFIGSMGVWLRGFATLRLKMISHHIRQELRILAVTSLMELDLKSHEKEGVGNKLEKISTGSKAIEEAMEWFRNWGISILTGILGSLFLFLTLNWKYVAYAMVYFVIFVVAEQYFTKRWISGRQKLSIFQERISGRLHESLSNVLTVKALGLKEEFKRDANQFEKEYYKLWLNQTKLGNFKKNFIKIFTAVGYAGFVLITGWDAFAGIITVGSIYVYASYFNRLRDSLQNTEDHIWEFISAKLDIGRLMTILDRKHLEQEDSNLPSFPDNWKEIQFLDVTFSYKSQAVLKDFNLTIHKGEKLGVVGRSGCGKSTLIKLLLGLYTQEKGQILIDGKALDSFKHSSLMRTMSVVLQDSEMFNRSLLDNIAISSVMTNQVLLARSLWVSYLAQLVKKLPRGLDTLIGEKGYKVSGGERQRIGIARAIYKDSPILILDEATSHLDSKTETFIQKRMESWLKDRTLLIVAHRLSTLKRINRIIVMETGRIVEEGTFSQLVRKKGRFYQLYKHQKNR